MFNPAQFYEAGRLRSIKGLIYYNKFDGISKDSSGLDISTINPIKGTIWNYESSIKGQGLNLSGNDVISVGSSNDYFSLSNGTSDLPATISCVIKNNTINSSYNSILGKMAYGTSGVNEWFLAVNVDRKLFFFKVCGVTGNVLQYTSSTSLVNNNSYHIIFITDGINAWFVINGVKESANISINGSGIYNYMHRGNRQLTIFQLGTGSTATRYMKGTISQLGIFNRMLSDEECLKIWNNGSLINLK